jgi:hypothetical protein
MMVADVGYWLKVLFYLFFFFTEFGGKLLSEKGGVRPEWLAGSLKQVIDCHEGVDSRGLDISPSRSSSTLARRFARRGPLLLV